MQTALLIVDPQVDFCDPHGALSLPGAEADMARLATLIRRVGPSLDTIHVTLDSHHPVHVAHPLFWRDEAGQPPAPFTLIRAADVEAGCWTTAKPELLTRVLGYVRALEAGGRYVLCIWPPHCLVGGPGHAVAPPLWNALTEWEEQQFKIVQYVQKGGNPLTEHYSAFQAEIPDPDDPSTQMNTALADALARADTILVAGEAGSHCVANSVRDLAEALGGEAVRKIVLLTDAVSPVTGFERFQDEFIQDLTARGMRWATTMDFMA